jgi:uncharacterized protein (DUF1697 family)
MCDDDPMATRSPAKAKSGQSGKQAAGAWVALLRGINVGGKNLLGMTALASMFEEAGCEDVRTYIQSGNVVFRASAPRAKGLAGEITAAIERDFDLRVPVILRASHELERVSRNNAFLARGLPTASLHVMFLADAPDAAAIARLDPTRSPPDEFIVDGREVYLWFANGAGRTKLTNQYFDSRLATTSTLRNWNTVLKLTEMAGA